MGNTDQIQENRCLGVIYRIARTPTDFQHVSRLWKAVYVDELGWLPDGAAHPADDGYHPYSTYLLAYAVDESESSQLPIATLRVVASSPLGLPVQQFMPLPSSIRAWQPVEIQRFMILDGFRSKRVKPGAPYGVSFGMIKACVQLCMMRGYSHYILDSFVNSPLSQVETFRLIGFEELGAPFRDTELAAPYMSVALFLDSARLASHLYGGSSRLLRYLRTDDPSLRLYD